MLPIAELKSHILKQENIQLRLSLVVWMSKNGYWHPTEWIMVNNKEIPHYSLGELKDAINQHGVDFLNSEFDKSKKDKGVAVVGHYPIWDGDRDHPHIVGYEHYEGFKKNNIITTTKGVRKNVRGKYLHWQIKE